MKCEIVQKGNKALTNKAQEVATELITGKGIKELIQNMKDTLAYEYEGVAIAAPQIGAGKRIFVVAGKVFEARSGEPSKDVAYINPKITKTSTKTLPLEEGCLSVSNVFGTVQRHEKVTIEYYDENGEWQSKNTGGFLAHIFQHEFDHLEGIVFTEKATNVEQLDASDQKRLDLERKKHIEELEKINHD